MSCRANCPVETGNALRLGEVVLCACEVALFVELVALSLQLLRHSVT